MTTAPSGLTLTPFRHGASWPRVLGIVGSTVPACAVAVGIGLDDGQVLPGRVLSALALLVALTVAVVVARSRIELAPGTFRRTRAHGGAPVRSGTVVRAVFRRIQNRDEVSSQRHLFLLDADDRPVLRLSDRWWTEEQMQRVVDHVGAPVESMDEVVYLGELRRTVPAQLRRRERHPASWAAVKVILLCAASLGIAALATAAL